MATRYTAPRVKRTIVEFHQDAEGHWIAELSCGHGQHFRHTPPWMTRPWVLTPEGRQQRIGAEVDCRRCDAGEPGGANRANGANGANGAKSAKSADASGAGETRR